MKNITETEKYVCASIGFEATPETKNRLLQQILFLRKHDMLPKAVKDQSDKKLVLIALYGNYLKFNLLQSLKNITTEINKMPTLHTDGYKILVHRSNLCDLFQSGYKRDKEYGWCKVRRKGMVASHTTKFYLEDARTAGLIRPPPLSEKQKASSWIKYPTKMCINRATTFALRDIFADILYGIGNTEEEQDIQLGYQVKQEGKMSYNVNFVNALQNVRIEKTPLS